jgi:hypothetical protein
MLAAAALQAFEDVLRGVEAVTVGALDEEPARLAFGEDFGRVA